MSFKLYRYNAKPLGCMREEFGQLKLTQKWRTALKGKRQAKDQMNALYFLNGKCNAKYFLHYKFLTENGIDLQNFINLGWVIIPRENEGI